jgi:Innexin
MGQLDPENNDRQQTIHFTEDYLRRDGLFVLKLVAKNSTDLVVADIVAALWDNYRTKPVGAHGQVHLANNARRTSIYQEDENADDGDKV